MKREEEGYMPPLSASPIPEPPYHMTDQAEYLYVFFDADRDALAYEVPEPLELASSGDKPAAYAAIGQGHQPPKNMAPFHEGIIGVRVEYNGQEGWYIPYIWVSNEESMLNGRVFGYPKQLCDDDEGLNFDGNEIWGAINRREETLFRVRFSSQSPPENYREESLAEKMSELKGGIPALQFKKVPSPAAEGKTLRQIIRNEIQDFSVREIWEGNASLEFFPHGSYPHLADLSPTEIHSAFFVRPDFVLSSEPAEIVWEEFE